MLKKILKSKFRRVLLAMFDLCCFFAIAFMNQLLSGREIGSMALSAKVHLMRETILLLSVFAVRFVFKIYNTVWRYTSTGAYIKLILADAVGFILGVAISLLALPEIPSHLLSWIWYGAALVSMNLLVNIFARKVYRLLYKRYRHKKDGLNDSKKDKRVRIAIVGAGQLGAYLANELRGTPGSKYIPVCFIDVSKNKIGCSVSGLPVYSDKDVKSVIEKFKISEFVIAIANADADKTERMWKKYSELGCNVKIYDAPLHGEAEKDKQKKRVIRDFSIEDLLFRQPIPVNEKENRAYYTQKTVLITGGGGSIGSELCRQIAKCAPKKLVIFDVYENNAYDIQQELRYKYGEELDLAVEIGSVRDKERLELVFERYTPDIVFHAAAHKHVPLMEHNPAEALKNNVLGTYNAADLAEKYGVEKFILISTDKAVNPTNVMGATKRICEMIVQCRHDSKTNFAAVRFGNVLGSNGSVIPLFKRQIASGGPITITDKRIIRYFMTIPEASQLVMLAGTKAKRGELFILDMGKPVRIYDLAVNMIKLMGYVPDEDIEIREIGLRPGEKLFEELLIKGESVTKTDNDMIFIEKDTPYTREEVDEKLDALREIIDAASDDTERIKSVIRMVVPTFVEPEAINDTIGK